MGNVNISVSNVDTSFDGDYFKFEANYNFDGLGGGYHIVEAQTIIYRDGAAIGVDTPDIAVLTEVDSVIGVFISFLCDPAYAPQHLKLRYRIYSEEVLVELPLSVAKGKGKFNSSAQTALGSLGMVHTIVTKNDGGSADIRFVIECYDPQDYALFFQQKAGDELLEYAFGVSLIGNFQYIESSSYNYKKGLSLMVGLHKVGEWVEFEQDI